MLTAQNITFTVGAKALLDDISVQFPPGKLNLIIGPNGAGKSTLIKVLSNQIQPQKGNVFYGTNNVKTFSIVEQARMRAVLSQTIELAFPLKVKEVVMMGRYPHFTGKPGLKDENAVQEAMAFFEIQEMADRNYLTLSGGEKQRVNFAKVMSQIWYPIKEQARYLILDEPLTFLDIHYQYDFMNQITSLLAKSADLVVVGVVHDLNLAAKFGDQIILLNQARLLASGSPEEVLTKELIKAAYRIEPKLYRENGLFHLFF